MDERAEIGRRRFRRVIEDARAVIRDTADGQSLAHRSTTSLLVAVKAMHRAGGFLEAIILAYPDLGKDLIAEFEQFAFEVERVYGMPVGDWVRRDATDRRAEADRRDARQRSDTERRAMKLEVLVERRTGVERRGLEDRRGDDRRLVPDRRFGSAADLAATPR